MLRVLGLNAKRKGLGDGMDVEHERIEPKGESALWPDPMSVSL